MKKNLLYSDKNSDRIYKFSNFNSTVLDSFSSISTEPQGIAYDGQHVISADSNTDRIYKFSGFSSTVLDSFSSIGTAPTGLVWDEANLYNADSTTNRIYKLSGFSSTVVDSFSSPGTAPQGLAWDGNNLCNSDSVTDRIYKFSGFSSTVLDSFSSIGATPTGLTWDGNNLYNADSTTDRIYKFSGFSSTVLDSFSSTNTDPTGLAFEATISTNDCFELNNGDLLSVYNSGQGGTSYSAISKRYDTSTKTWGSEVTIDSGNTGYTHPTVCQLASNASTPNRILCAYRDKAAGTINIYKSDDNASIWTSLTTITVTLEENTRLSLARSGNTICLVYSKGRVSYSRKSTDNGSTWSIGDDVVAISAQGGAIYPSITVMDSDSFACAYQTYHTTSGVYGRIYISSSVDGSSWGLASSGVMINATERYDRPAIAKDDLGKLYVVAQDTISKDLRIVKSTSVNGHNWSGVENVNPLTNEANKGLYSPSICSYDGKLFIQAEAWDGTNSHLVGIKTKNWRNINESLGYTYHYTPILGLPDRVGGWAFTNSDGTSSESAGLLNLVTTSSVDNHSYTKSDIGDTRTSAGIKLRFKVKVNSGGSITADDIILTLILSDGVNSCKLTLRLKTTDCRLIDVEDSNATIATVTHAFTNEHEFLIAIQNNDLSAWYRSTHDKEIEWNEITDNYQIDVTGTDTDSSIQFGILTAIADIDVYDVAYVLDDDGLSDGFTNPDDLISEFTAGNSISQYLTDGVEITWSGSDGIVNDSWTIQSAFTFPKEDMLTDSPSNFVRTENDGSEHVYVLDAGENKVFNVDQFNFVNGNIRTGKFQMNATDSWSSPTLDQSFTVVSQVSGSITAITENTLTDSSLSMNINQLARPNRPMFLRMTSGSASGNTYAIESNTSTLIKLTTASLVADGAATSDTYVVYGDRITQQVTATNLRFIRFVIDAQETSDDYYKIGKFVAGMKLQLSKNFRSEHTTAIIPNVHIDNSSESGQKFSSKEGESREIFRLNFTHKTSGFTNEVEQFFESIDWMNSPFIFIKDSDNLQDFVLARLSSNYQRSHIVINIYDIESLTFEEEL